MSPGTNFLRRWARGKPRVALSLVAIVVAVFGASLWLTTASAVHTINLIELDGNVADADPGGPPADWEAVCKEGTATATTPLCTTATGVTGASKVLFISDGTGSVDDQPATGGTKDTNDIPSWDCKIANISPPKNDMLHAFAAVYNNSVNGDDYIYFGLDRQNSDNGNANVGFWFFKPESTDGLGCAGC